MKERARAVIAALAFMAVALVPSLAGAQDDLSSRRKAAQDLADSAFDLMQKGRFEAAADLFKKADETFHSPVFVLFLADANEKMGELVEARRLLQTIVDEKLAEYAPDAFRTAQQDAIRRVGELDAKIPTVTLTIQGGGSETVVVLDSRTLVAGELGKPIPLDYGKHQVRATKGSLTDERTFEVGEGDSETIELVLVGDVLPDDDDDDDDVVEDSGEGVPNWVWPTVAYSVGGVGLVIGAVGGIAFLGALGDLEDKCKSDGDDDPKSCPPDAVADGESVHTLGDVSTVGWVIAGVGVVAGTVLLFVPFGEQGAVVGGSTRLHVGPTGAAVSGRF